MTSEHTETTAGEQSPEERAALLRAELAELEAEDQRRQQAAAARLAAHQTAVDAEVVASYPQRRPALEADVVAARAELDAAIAESPVTQALAGYYTAAAARRQALAEHVGALGRQGRDVSGVQFPSTHTVDLAEAMDRIAQAAASDFHIRQTYEAAVSRWLAAGDTDPEEQK
jgi:hypothetical protein